MATPAADWVRAAHGDAWQTLGIAGTAELPGVRLSATGLSHPQWNNGDVDDPALVDIDAVRNWYADRDVPWGMRVPQGADWPHGRYLFTKRLMGLVPSEFRRAPAPAGVTFRAADTADIDAVAHIDGTAFDAPSALVRPWIELLTKHPSTFCAIAERDGVPVASGQVTVSHGRAGRAGYVTGIAVLPDARRRGVGAAISSWLIEHSTADLWHLHPDTDEAARIYQRLGFVAAGAFDVYVDN
jgi:ribosomal protein S18 acetylase RimI-like enzyme